MLKFLRNKKNQKRIFLGMTLVILPPFLFWGVAMNDKEDGASASSTLGVIGNKKVSIKDYLGAYRAVQHEAAILYGSRAKEAAKVLNFRGRAWDRLLLLDHAGKEKVQVKDKEVTEWLISQPAFSHDGRFDKEFYNRYVNEAMRISPREFEEEIRQMLTLVKLQEKVESGVQVSDEELKKLYDEEHGVRDIRYAHLAGDAAKAELEVTDEELSKIYPLVKDRLTEPERVKIRYAAVPPDKTETMKEVIADSAVLDEIAKKYGLKTQETAYFSKNDPMPEFGFSKPLLSAAFSLAVNSESGWIHTDKGVFKIQVVDKKEERVLPIEEAKSELRRVLGQQKAVEEALKKLSDLRKTVTQPSDLEKALADAKIEMRRLEGFGKNSELPGVGVLPDKAAELVAALTEGQVSEAMPVEGGAVLVQVEKRHGPDAQKFESDKKDFKERVIQKKSQEAMNALLEKLRNRLSMNLELMKKLSV